MVHYVCSGSCAGEWPKPGLCDSQFCTKEGKPLLECNCDDGQHLSVLEKKVPEESPDLM